MTWVAVGVGAVSLGTGIYESAHKAHQANQLMKNNPRPSYQIPDEYRQNLAIAQNMARIGLPQQQYNNQANAINSRQAGAVASLGNSANPGAGLAQIVRAGNDATGNLNAQDATARQANERYAINQNTTLGQQKLAQQQYNQFDKYSENFNRAQALRGAANQDLSNGINGAVQVGSAALMSGNLGQRSSGQYVNQGGQWYSKGINGYEAVNPYVQQAQGIGVQGSQLGANWPAVQSYQLSY